MPVMAIPAAGALVVDTPFKLGPGVRVRIAINYKVMMRVWDRSPMHS